MEQIAVLEVLVAEVEAHLRLEAMEHYPLELAETEGQALLPLFLGHQ